MDVSLDQGVAGRSALDDGPGRERCRRRGGPLVLRLTAGDVSGPGQWAGWCLFALLGCVATAGLVTMGVMPQDEGELLTYPWLFAHGSLPYRDFFVQYPPSTFVLLAALVKMGVPALIAERGLSISVRVLYVLAVNRTLTGSWHRFSWVGAPATFGLLFFAPDADIRAYPWVVGLPVLWLGLAALRRCPGLAAALFFVAATFRFEFGVAGIVALGTLVVFDRKRGKSREYLLGIVALLTGLTVFFLGLGLLTGGAALRDIFVDSALAISPGRKLPLWPPNYGAVGLLLAIIMVSGPTVLVVASAVTCRCYQLASNLAVLSLVPHFLQRADWLGLRMVAVVTVPWLVVCLRDVLRDHEARRGASLSPRATTAVRAGLGAVGMLVGVSYTFLVLVFVTLVAPLTLASAGSRLVSEGQRGVIVWTKQEARDDLQIARFIRSRTEPGDRVFIAPVKVRYAMYNSTQLYYLLGLPPASHKREMHPGVETQASIRREIISELSHCRLIVLTRAGYWYEPNASQIPGRPLLQRFIWRRYRIVLSNTSFQLLRSIPPGSGSTHFRRPSLLATRQF